MRYILTLAAVFIGVAGTANAGDLTFDNGQTTWHSTQCTAPTPPGSVIGAAPNTPGNDMNSLIAEHNTYVDAAQKYMDCVSQEADRDQSMVNQAIALSARRIISDMQNQVESSAEPLRAREERMRQRAHDDP